MSADDIVGMGVAIDGLSTPHRNYLAAGPGWASNWAMAN